MAGGRWQMAGATAVGPWVTRWGRWQGNPRFSEEFVTHLETELEQSRLRESETLGALKEMQDKVLDMEKVTGDAGRPVTPMASGMGTGLRVAQEVVWAAG